MRVGNKENLKSGDRYDLLLFSFPEGFPNSKLEFKIGDNPRKITGVQKVVQTFLRCLIQQPKSDPIYPNRGTKFQNYALYSNIQLDPAAARATLSSAVKDAADQARSMLNSFYSSLESQLDVVEVVDIRQQDDYTMVQVRVITRAGTEAPIALPFNANGLNINEVRNG